MKLNSPSLSLLLASVLSGVLSLQAAEITEAPSAEEVSAKRRTGGREFTEAGVKKLSGEIQVEERKVSLLNDSHFLVGHYGYTLVPKGAVFSSSKAITLVKSAPAKGKLLKWEDFHRKHRASLRLIPITDGQWTGEASLDPVREVIAAAASSRQAVVTSLNGFPVSISALAISPKKVE